MLRITAGLETLHAQGLLHRNLDRWAILTTGGEQIDFQLTGFEWSLRLVSAATTMTSPQTATHQTSAEPASFLQDWKALGSLIAELVGTDLRRLADSSIPASRVSEHLIAEEVKLMRNLVQAEPLDRLDGEVVSAHIEGILHALGAMIAGRDPKFHLVLRLGTGAPLSELIGQNVDSDIEISDVTEQLSIVSSDLSYGPKLVTV
ncbi:MAG: hypothetical protein U1E21_06065 [Reyranellaceae bacterium]